MIDLFLVRHAQCVANVNRDIISGRNSASPLTPLGCVQAKDLGVSLRNIKFDYIHSSTAVRAYQTADIAMRQNAFVDANPNIYEHSDLEELDQGDWAGRERSGIYTKEMVEMLERTQPDFRPPNGESQRDVGLRMDMWVNDVAMCGSGRVIVFCHGLVIRTWLQRVMNFDPKWIFNSVTSNASVTRLKYDGENWGLVNYNWVTSSMNEFLLEE